MQSSVEYLGHLINADGLHPTSTKVEAIVNAQEPRNVSELRSFLGMVQYYARFLPNLSTQLKPLHDLLQASVPWNWSSECQDAFKQAKEALGSADVLTHYDIQKPIRLACDASPYGVGAVLSHVFEDGSERPIAYASRSLDKAERNYSQIEKEALGIIFGVKKFHSYVYGRKFTLVTDHKPLVAIFGPKKGIPTLAAARLQRWAIILSAHTYDIEFRGTREHANADALSRLPLPTGPDKERRAEESLYNICFMDDLPVGAEEIGRATSKDPTLNRAYEYTANGWPNQCDDPDLKPYFVRRSELSIDQDCLLWGRRVVIPRKLRSRLLAELHDAHLGICRMKALARSHIWWPLMDAEIEQLAKNCTTCASYKNIPAKAPLHSWKWPTRCLERVHIDYAEKNGQHYLVMIDAHSKWPEVIPMGTSTTTSKTIMIMRNWFAAYGLPETIVSDNGPQFTSHEFADFLAKNGVRHVRVSPYHPASNGAAERMVQELKRFLAGVQGDTAELLQHKMANWLFRIRNTPHTLTQCTPAELFLRRQPRTRLTLVKPSLSKRVEHKQEKIESRSEHNKLRDFLPGDSVMVRNFRSSQKWQPGVIMQRLGTLSYMVKVHDQFRHVHVDHIVTGPQRTENFERDNGAKDTVIDIPNEAAREFPQAQPAARAVANQRRNPPRRCGPPNKLNL